MRNKVKELRKSHKLTQGALAGFIGISRQAVNAIEKGKFDPSLSTAFKLAKLFKTTIEALFLFSDEDENKHHNA